jgi:hypothetical protein
VLQRKGGGQPGLENDEGLMKKVQQQTAKAPPAPAPPPGAPPAGHLRTMDPERPKLTELLQKKPQALKPKEFGEEFMPPPPKDPWPVPDWVVCLTSSLVNIFMFGIVTECCIFILYFGSYMKPGVVWATHGATFIGFVVNLGLFESVKCVVVGCVALVKDETAKRQAEIAARRARMALKAQRLQDRTRRWKADTALPHLPPPPMIG